MLMLLAGVGSIVAQPSASFSEGNYLTLGNPFTALATSDSQYVFVSVTNVGGPNYFTPDSEAGNRHGVVSGVQIFRNETGVLHSAGFLRLGGKGANGMAFIKGEKTLMVAVGDLGVALVNVHDAIEGNATPLYVSQGAGAGTFDVVATPDGKHIFSANDYGYFRRQRVNVGIIALQSDAFGRVTAARSLGYIPSGNKVPSLTLSPDGSRLYILREILPGIGLGHVAGRHNPTLSKENCVQIIGSPPEPNGVITVVSVKQAIASGSGQKAILREVAAGCSPVRAVESHDSSTLYVSARGDNRILVYSTHQLEVDPNHALLRAFDSGGVAPVGIGLIRREQCLLVANSNRFHNDRGGIAVIDLADPAKPRVLERIPSGEFPRNINLASAGRAFFVTNYTSRTLEIFMASDETP